MRLALYFPLLWSTPTLGSWELVGEQPKLPRRPAMLNLRGGGAEEIDIDEELGRAQEEGIRVAKWMLEMHRGRNRVLGGKYLVISELGSGAFGTVVHCGRLGNMQKQCAIKMLVGTADADHEHANLQTLMEGRAKFPGNEGKDRVMSYFGRFEHAPMLHCLKFELLPLTLRDLLRINKIGMHMEHVRAIGDDCLSALAYCHGLGLVHTDIKPENIALLVAPIAGKAPAGFSSSAEDTFLEPQAVNGVWIKLIDFGSASGPGEDKITTLPYRSPEAVRGLRWSYSSDIWSLGCVLGELACGRYMVDSMVEGARDKMEKIHAMLADGLDGMVGPFSPELVEFLRSHMLNLDPSLRQPAWRARAFHFFTRKDGA